MKKRIMALITSICVLTASLSATTVSATERHLNIAVKLGTTETSLYGVPSAFTTRFPQIEAAVVDKYYWAFGIDLDFDYGGVQGKIIKTVVEDCKTVLSESAYNSYCTHTTSSNCSNDGPYHHTNKYVIYNDVTSQYPYDISETAEMYVTPVALCSKSGTTHYGVVGTAWKNEGFLLIRDYDYIKSDSTGITYVTAVMVHEIGHLYGTVDHSDTSYGSSVDNCLWGYNNDKFYVQENLTICANCGNTIYSNRNKYNHS